MIPPLPHDHYPHPADTISTSPYILSRVDWKNPRNDPIFRQFIPMKSVMILDHPMLTLDSLHEEGDSAVEGLVHRYTDKALFLRELSLRCSLDYIPNRQRLQLPRCVQRTACSAPGPMPWDHIPIRCTSILSSLPESGGIRYSNTLRIPQHFTTLSCLEATRTT